MARRICSTIGHIAAMIPTVAAAFFLRARLSSRGAVGEALGEAFGWCRGQKPLSRAGSSHRSPAGPKYRHMRRFPVPALVKRAGFAGVRTCGASARGIVAALGRGRLHGSAPGCPEAPRIPPYRSRPVAGTTPPGVKPVAPEEPHSPGVSYSSGLLTTSRRSIAPAFSRRLN